MSIVIFLNGCGSSGKTVIAKSIQHLSDAPWLRLGMDMLIDMIPERYIAFGDKAREGYFSFVPGHNDRGPTMHVEMTPKGSDLFGLMPSFAKVLADQGNQLIIDEVLFGDDILKAYGQALLAHTTYFVGVFCDLPKMQEREILRGDRAIGLSNDQLDRVHTDIKYDLKIDTTRLTPFEAAKQILDFVAEVSEPQALKTMCK
ncbi:MAG: hypothetical protein WCG04_00625 [Alphaproteobacteria bacterium]